MKKTNQLRDKRGSSIATQPTQADPNADRIQSAERRLRVEIEELNVAKAEADRTPTVDQLTKLAASLALVGGKSLEQEFSKMVKLPVLLQKGFVQQVPEFLLYAYKLWKFGQRLSIAACEAEIERNEFILSIGVDEYFSQKTFPVFNFPLNFESGLKELIGNKIRKADRYKIFRDFLRYCFMPQCGGGYQKASSEVKDNIENVVAEKFQILKSAGFSEKQFSWAQKQFPIWDQQRSSEKARKAARARWAKKKKELA